MTAPQTIIIQGLTLDGFNALLKQAIREVQAETAESGAEPPITDELTASEAAQLLKYKSGASLRQYHHRGLTPLRRGKQLLYATAEVLALKKKLIR